MSGWATRSGARSSLPAMRALGRPSAERVVPSTYVELQSRYDVVDGHALRRYAKGHYFRELTDEVIDTMVAVTEVGPFAPGVGLQAYGGAIADVPEDDTAFSHRGTAFELGASTGWTDPAEDEVRIGDGTVVRRDARAVRLRGLRQRPGRRGRRRRTPGVLGREAGPAHRREGHLRPAERLPPQPEHPTLGRTRAPPPDRSYRSGRPPGRRKPPRWHERSWCARHVRERA